MLDSFDYKEPRCVFCDGKEFYYPDSNAPKGRIPVDRVTAKLDALLGKKDYEGAKSHLSYWLKEAEDLGDERGALAILNEMTGFYRKTAMEKEGLEAVEKAVALCGKLALDDCVEGATVLLNSATALHSFGKTEKALSLYGKAAKIYERDLRPDDVRLAGLYNNRATSYASSGMLAEAEKGYLDALKILEKQENSLNEIAVTYVNLAHVYEADGQKTFFDIKDALEKAYLYLTDEKTKKDAYNAFMCEKCAPSFDYFGYGDKGEDLLARAKEIYERT